MELPKVEVMILVNGEPVSLIDYVPKGSEQAKAPPKEEQQTEQPQPREEGTTTDTAPTVEEANKAEAQRRQESEGTQVSSPVSSSQVIKKEEKVLSHKTRLDVAASILVTSPQEWISGEEPMTRPQGAYLRTLCREAGVPMPEIKNKGEASRHIEALREMTGKGPRALTPKSFPSQQEEKDSIAKKEQIKVNMSKIQEAIAQHHLREQAEAERRFEEEEARKLHEESQAVDIKVL